MKRRISELKPICRFAFYRDNGVATSQSSDPTEQIIQHYGFDTDDYDDTNKDLSDLNTYFREDFVDSSSMESEHFNLLLLDSNEWPNPDGNTGVGSIGTNKDPRTSVLLGGTAIADHDDTAHRYGPRGDSVEGKIRGAIHEIGHNLGMRHADGYRYEDSFFGEITTFATPQGCGAGGSTSCNTNCANSSVDQWDHYYGNCEISNIVP